MVTSSDGKTTQKNVDDMDVYVWKKDFEKAHNKESEFKAKEERATLIVLGQCSPSLRSQLEDTQNFVEICKKMILLNS